VYLMFGEAPPIAVPKLFVALPISDDAPGMIILEDLSQKATVIPSHVHGMTYPQIVATIIELARMHAWSLTTPVDWHSKISTREERLRKDNFANFGTLYNKTKEKYPEYFGSINVEKLVHLTNYESFLALFNEHREFMDDVLVHGDLHALNIMFEKNEDGSASDRLVALIDFQMVARGSPANDFGRLFCFSVPPVLRREHYNDILRRYYDEVKSIAGDKFKASFGQFRTLVDRQFALGAVAAILDVAGMCEMLARGGGDGEQKQKDELKALEFLKANYDDAANMLGL